MLRWFVFLQDTNGSRRYVGDPCIFEDEAAADARITEIEGAHTKPHKLDYWKLPFAGSRAEFCKEYDIVE